MQDFEIRIGAKLSDGTYEVIVRSETGGRASGKLEILWDDDEIEKSLETITKCIKYEGDPGQDLLKELGDKFYQALIEKDTKINSFFERSLGRAEAKENGLRIRLWIEPYELRRLPWEFLFRKRDSRFIAKTDKFAFVRYEENPERQKELKANLPLKILVITVNTKEKSQKREKEIISNILNSHEDKFVADFLDSPSITDLHKKLIQDKFKVIHFIGHGDMDSDGKGYLILNKKQKIESTEFRDLVEVNDIRLIVLNSCETAKASRDPFLSIGSTLTKAGIPAVIAMQYKMPEKSAKIFSDIFYTALAKFLPIDQCITQARINISANLGEHIVDWGIPVLFMNAKDGVILKKGGDTTGKKQTPKKKQEDKTKISIKGNVGQFAVRDIINKSVKLGKGSTIFGDIITGKKVIKDDRDKEEKQSDSQTGKTNSKKQNLLELLKIHENNLHNLELQKAKYGSLSVPTNILNQIKDEEEEIEGIKKQLKEAKR